MISYIWYIWYVWYVYQFSTIGITQSNGVGVAYEYSNLGYALLGMIISNVSKVPYQQYIRDNILLPLDMTNTTYEYSEVRPDDFAPGFRFEVYMDIVLYYTFVCFLFVCVFVCMFLYIYLIYIHVYIYIYIYV